MTPFVGALLATLVAAWGVRRLMLRVGVMDIPNARSSHTLPTPRGGGFACLIGVLAAGLAAQRAGIEVPWPLIGVAFALAVVGFADDSQGLGAVSRLVAQAAAGAAIGAAVGGGWLLALGAATALVVVNSVNFMDGINGITSLNMAVWGVTAWLVGLSAGVGDLWVVGAAAAGAALGFLPWNAPHARLFLGDTGSYLFGALVSAGVLVATATRASPIVVVAPLTIYLADTGSVLVLRARRGEPLMTAHRDHAYQVMTRSPRVQHIWVSLLVATLAGMVTLLVATLPLWIALPLSGIIGVAYVVFPRTLSGDIAAGPLRAPGGES